MSDVSTQDILRAVMRGDLEQLAMFKHAGVGFAGKSQPERWSLIHQACLLPGRKLPAQSLRFLLAAGADATGMDIHGNTPLHYAVRGSHLEATRMLLAAGANVHALNHDQQTPLHLSLINSTANPELVQALLDGGADPVQAIAGDKTLMDLVQVLACEAGDVLRELFAHYAPPSLAPQAR